MASLRDQFQHYYVPDDFAIEEAVQTGMVVPDTNVLLSLYRFQSGARENLFQALEKVGDRLWIPHQVGHEFHERRLDVMREQESYFSATQGELDKLVDAVQGKIRNFRTRIALSPESMKEIEDGITRLRDLMTEAVKKAEEANEVRLSDHSSDDILARVLELFPDGRVGDPMEPKELEEAIKEAERRRQDKVPPGYKDKGPGDYLVWRQLMNEARERKLPVVLVTDDRKEDWYWVCDGKTLGARRELRKEIMDEAGVPLIMMTTDTFLRHAETYLDVPLSPETVNQVTSPVFTGPIYVSGSIFNYDPYSPQLEALRAVADLPAAERELLLSMLARDRRQHELVGRTPVDPVAFFESLRSLGMSDEFIGRLLSEIDPRGSTEVARQSLARILSGLPDEVRAEFDERWQYVEGAWHRRLVDRRDDSGADRGDV